MKVALIVIFATFALVAAEPPVNGGSGYGVPQSHSQGSSGGFGGGSSSSGFGGGSSDAEYQSQTYKNVYVYSAPDEPADVQSRTIRVPGGDKHVNIIFVKTPSSSSQQQTEVILPEQDEHKSLVYVLLKKAESSSDVKITRPNPRPQSKPEVNFIRYQDQAAAAAPSQQFGAAPIRAPSQQFGAAPIRAPSQQYGF